MTLALLPLGHFICGVLCLAFVRRAWLLSLLAWVMDGVLVGILLANASRGQIPSLVLGGWVRGFGIELAADRFSLGFCVLLLVLSGSVLAYLWRERLNAYFFMLIHLLLGSVFALLFARDLFNIYVIMELLTLVSFLLVGYEKRPDQIWASLKYLFLASFGMAIYLFGVVVVYDRVGTVNLLLVAERLSGSSSAGWIPFASALLASGVAVKAGIFLFSLWLPAAHSCASPAVSALLSGLVIKMGVVVLYRLAAVFPLTLPLVVLGGITGVFGIVYAMYTYDLKKMLAFHTLSQIGYLLIGIGIGSAVALTGSLQYAIGHGFFKGLLFLAAGTAAQRIGRDDLSSLIAKRSALSLATRGSLLLGTLGIVGFPPLAGFCGKSVLSIAATSPVIQGVLVLLSVGTAASFAKLLPLFWLGSGPPSSWAERISYAALALPIVLFLPVSRFALPLAQWRETIALFPIVESLVVIGAGFLIYRLLPRRFVFFGQRIFRLEEAFLILLSCFFIVFVLCILG